MTIDSAHYTRCRVVDNSFAAIEGSCLVPLLEAQLKNESLLDIHRHAKLYHTCLQVVRAFSTWPHLVPLLAPLASQERGKSLSQLLLRMERRVQVFERTKAKGGGQQQGHQGQEVATSLETTSGAALAAGGSSASASASVSSSSAQAMPAEATPSSHLNVEAAVLEAMADVRSAQESLPIEMQLNEMTDDARGESKTSPPLRVNNKDNAGGGGSSSSNGNGQEGGQEGVDIDALYIQQMRVLTYDEAPELAGYKYRTQAASSSLHPMLSTHTRRLAAEHADLSHSLPVTPSSSVFVLTHAERMDCLQVAIVGPEDTPYSGGVFLFDVYFPPMYPKVPMLVNLQTTGNGTVRFNPNLYNCGKVCLSILGTWAGSEGEMWNENTSTLLQVLISIQSLILCPQPFFNEPGFEREMGTPVGEAHNKRYNETIREATVRWAMLEALRHPVAGFERIVRSHFFLRKQFIIDLVDTWLEEASTVLDHRTKLKQLITALKRELSKLTPP
jgi:baculoviral IAP repeat-containing protein 6